MSGALSDAAAGVAAAVAAAAAASSTGVDAASEGFVTLQVGNQDMWAKMGEGNDQWKVYNDLHVRPQLPVCCSVT